MNRNPFHVLGLPTSADEAKIVERVEELHHELSAADLVAAQAAKTALLTDPAVRRLHELLEVPGARYGDEEWDTFVRRNGRLPVDAETLLAGSRPPMPGDFDLAAIAGLLAAALLDPLPVDPGPALREPPCRPGPGGPPLEVADVLFG